MRWLAIIGLCLAVAACGGPLRFLPGVGGPKVAANVQAGRTNAQTIGQTQVQEQRIETATAEVITQEAGDNAVRAQRVDRVVVQQAPVWMVIAMLLGWILPTPQSIALWLVGRVRVAIDRWSF